MTDAEIIISPQIIKLVGGDVIQVDGNLAYTFYTDNTSGEYASMRICVERQLTHSQMQAMLNVLKEMSPAVISCMREETR